MFCVLCNCPAAGDVAPRLARALVERRLAACVNLLPGVRSIYAWQGEVCDEAEITLLIKTSAAQMTALREAIVELHPYDVPEVVALPVDAAASLPAYLNWVQASCGEKDSAEQS